MFTIDLKRYRLVDLSVVIEPPGTEDRPLQATVGRLADHTYKMDITRLHSHVGTHVEAPAHFYDQGKLITDVPLEDFFGPAALLSIDDASEREVTDDVLDGHLSDILQMALPVAFALDSSFARAVALEERQVEGPFALPE